MSSQCEHLGRHGEFESRFLDRERFGGEPPENSGSTAALGSMGYHSVGTGVVATNILLALATVCGMSLIVHHQVTYDYFLTGLAVSVIISSFTLYFGASIIREIERGRWDLIASEERIRQIAHFDAVTGLPNRILLKDRMTKALSEANRNRTPLAILFIDLDRFKSINDTMGHHVGDEVLKIIGERLDGALRDVDTVARLGGDEFVILLPRTDAKGASDVAEKIRDAVAQSCSIEGRDLSVTPSIGISMYPDDGVDVDTLIRNADTAMYRAKGAGANALRFFRPQTQDAARRRIALQRDIRRAFRQNEFTLRYQPQIDAQSGAIAAVAALLRWKHPERGLLAPDEFLPLVEASGLITPLSEWYLMEACREYAVWHSAGLLRSTVVIHLSGQHIRHHELMRQVLRILQRSGLKPCQLELEFAESSVTDNIAFSVDCLHEFKEHKIRIAINEFGTSHCSLTYLKGLPVDKLKIEPSFVQGLPRNHYDGIIARSMIDLAHSLQMKAVAEGVETPLQLKYLREKGCDIYQGSLFSEPLPAGAFMRSLQEDAAPNTPLQRSVA